MGGLEVILFVNQNITNKGMADMGDRDESKGSHKKCHSITALVERQEQVYETCIAISIDKHRIVRHTGGNATHVL